MPVFTKLSAGRVRSTYEFIKAIETVTASRRRLRIQPVVRQDDGLPVLQLGEDLRLEHVLVPQAGRLRTLTVVRCAAGRPVNMLDARVLAGFGDRVPRLKTLDFAAQLRSHLRAQVIGQCQKDLRSEGMSRLAFRELKKKTVR